MKDFYLAEPQHKSLLQETVIQALRSAPRFVIWGTGDNALFALEECQKFGLHPSFVVDSYHHSTGELYHGIPLIGEEMLFSQVTDYIVLLSCVSWHKIDQKLQRKGIPFVMFDCNFRSLLHLNKTDFQSLCNSIISFKPQLQEVYNMLEDDRSRRAFQNSLNFRLTLDYSLIDEVNTPHQYFGNDVLPYIHADTVIDCGAYNGDTLSAFFSLENCSCNQYFALEPSEKIFKQLVECSKKYQDKAKIIPLPIGAWNETSTLTFSNNGDLGDHPSDGDGISVKVDAIDNFASGCQVDLIKMDIEGSEMSALHGAVKTIQKYHPVLAICIYHRPSDFWEIPKFIKSLYSGYRFYVRHHSDHCSETVLYAIPQEL